MKFVKTAGTVAITSALLLTSSLPVWADAPQAAVATKISAVAPLPDSAHVDPQITKDQAIAAAKKYIQIPDGFTLESVNLNSYTMRNGQFIPSWSLNYVKRVKDQFYGNINVTINGMNGKLVGYSMYDNDPAHKPSYPPKVDYKGAKDIAAAWIQKMDLDNREQLRYNDRDEKSFRTPLDGNYQYNIHYDRSVDGVPFPENSVHVTVNGDGQVTSYNYMWDDSITFEKNVKPISLEKAAQTFRDQADISLTYLIPYQAQDKKQPMIAYTMNPFQLNAANGEPWSPGNQPRKPADKEGPITSGPLGEAPAAGLSLTKEQAIQKVTSTFKLAANAKLEDASYNEYNNPVTGEANSSWNLRWSLPESEDGASNAEAKIRPPGRSIWANVNSKTGEIMNYQMNLPYDPSGMKSVNGKVSQEEAKAKAIEFLKQQFPAYTSQLVPDFVAEKAVPLEQLKLLRNWDIHFKRVIDGVNAGYEGMNVGIDRETGDIVSFYNSFTTTDYPKQKPNVLPLDKAKELLFSQYDVELSYALNQNNMYMYDAKYKLMVASGEIAPGTPAQAQEPTVAQLVYSLTPKFVREPIVLDAQTGEWKNANNGEVTSLETVKVDDIEGHWAQHELQLMLDYQALDVKDGKANPDQSITRGEMIKMLVIAMNGGNGGFSYTADRKASFSDVKAGSAYFAYVENAVDRGLLEPGTDFKPEAKMNREEMAHLIVKALGYDTLTKYDAIFNDSFTDQAKLKNVGEAAIVTGLNIMTLTDGSFNPNQEVTKAQAAVAFYRYLQKRGELQDRQHRIY